MTDWSAKQIEFFELLNSYPSPHNGQPIRIKPQADGSYELYFQRERGLQAADVSFIFSFVSMGVFMSYAQACARALGHEIAYRLSLPSQDALRGSGEVPFGQFTIQWDRQPADVELRSAIDFRQTSRKKYTEGLTTDIVHSLIGQARQHGMQLFHLSPEQAQQAIWLNQRAVFDDMFDQAVNDELDHWLRYSKKDKEQKRDGLAYDCMQLNGLSMKLTVKHPGILRAPGLSGLIEKYYTRTMRDKSDVLYMLAPFSTEQDAFAVGVAIGELWLSVSREQYYLHPFGTIMSNHAAHRDFLAMAGVGYENVENNYLVFIFRAGRSAPPPRSLRLPYNQHLVME